eukprot:g36653.t1
MCLNALQEEVLETDTIAAFKKHLNKFMNRKGIEGHGPLEIGPVLMRGTGFCPFEQMYGHESRPNGKNRFGKGKKFCKIASRKTKARGQDINIVTKGAAMGTHMGPSYACLFVGYVEQSVFRSYTGPKPHLFLYYIDDCIGAASCSHEELEQFIH